MRKLKTNPRYESPNYDIAEQIIDETQTNQAKEVFARVKIRGETESQNKLIRRYKGRINKTDRDGEIESWKKS